MSGQKRGVDAPGSSANCAAVSAVEPVIGHLKGRATGWTATISGTVGAIAQTNAVLAASRLTTFRRP